MWAAAWVLGMSCGLGVSGRLRVRRGLRVSSGLFWSLAAEPEGSARCERQIRVTGGLDVRGRTRLRVGFD